MSKDLNQIDVDDYYDLTIQQRQILDDWLKSLGGKPTVTRSIAIDREAHIVTAEEYTFDNDGKMIYNIKTHDVEIFKRVLTYIHEPSIWK